MSVEPYGVVPVEPIADRLQGDEASTEVEARRNTSFEVELDEEPTGLNAPVYVDPPPVEGARLPIIPTYLRSVEGVKGAAERQARKGGHVALFHMVRSPIYVPWVMWWALVGLFRLINRQVSWWWRAEAAPLKREAIIENDPLTYTKIDSDDRKVRLFRGVVLGLELFAVLFAVSVLVFTAPRWLVVLVGLVATIVLARVGRNGRRLTPSAVVKPRYRKLRPDIVLRAYTVAKLIDPAKNPDDERIFGSVMTRDATNSGSQVVIDLPFGKTFGDAMSAKDKIASGLDVTTYQVFLTPDKSSERRHLLFVTDRNPADVPAGKTPLLDCKQRDIWQPALIGLDERGNRTLLDLMWQAILIGAQPRKGKTWTARHLLLFAGLDPWVKLLIVDAKQGAPDTRVFQSIADRCVFGHAPTARDGDPVAKLLSLLHYVRKHILRVGELLGELAEKHPELCPDGKLTPELARDPRFPELRVWLLYLDEFQTWYELDDPDTSEEIAQLLSDIRAVGPYAGVIVISATQKPSGIGGKQRTKELFTRYRDNHSVRIALKCGSRHVSEAVLGTEAYGEGVDATALPADAKGIGFVYGDRDQVPMVRFYEADNNDAITIVAAARKQRERLGLLTGEAAGLVIESEVVDVLGDVLTVMPATEKTISWPRLAARLAEQLPERYAGINADAISARIRAFPLIKGKVVTDKEFFPSGKGRGVTRSEVEQAAARRDKTR